MNDDTPDFPIHNDFTSERMTMASFLYISQNWNPSAGGYFNLYKFKEEDKPISRIAPQCIGIRWIECVDGSD
jgi:hypothetical protein